MSASIAETVDSGLAGLPFEAYRQIPSDELSERIEAVKRQMGDSLLILGHHYQQDEVIRFADHRGDSLKLAQTAAASQSCESIAFCGVHFMAETADVLSREEVTVHLPDLGAGCSMADMADLDAVEAAWADMGEIIDTDEITPVTYINSTAELKDFCARHDGIVCTSSNAQKVLDWAFARRRRVLFFPDQHLGRNTAKAMGIPQEEMLLWNVRREYGGHTPEAVENSRVLLWRGHCSVHQMFKPAHVAQFREKFPGIQILVHPECSMEVVDLADLVGSTGYIIKTIEEAPAGSVWAIGTELHLVNRLAAEHPDKSIHFLSPMVCLCATMSRIDLPHLAWCLENLAQGTPVNQIKVPDDVKQGALTALQRMLDLS